MDNDVTKVMEYIPDRLHHSGVTGQGCTQNEKMIYSAKEISACLRLNTLGGDKMQSHDLTGQLLGHYRIKRPIGYGGMATVFLAEDINLRRDIAVKVFEPTGNDSVDFFRRFEREAQVLAQLDHPNILPVYDFGQQSGVAYLITPYISGGSLRDLLRTRGGTLSVPETVRLMSQILNALQYAHDRASCIAISNLVICYSSKMEPSCSRILAWSKSYLRAA